jgi:hypothetical protein
VRAGRGPLRAAAAARAPAQAAVGFIGAQAAGTALSMAASAALFAACAFLAQSAALRRAAAAAALDLLPTLIGVPLLIWAIKRALYAAAVRHGDIQMRNTFSALEVYFGFLGLITGALLVLGRFTIAIVILLR